MQVGISCPSSLGEINEYFTDVVEELIGSPDQSNQMVVILELRPVYECPIITEWVGFDPNQLIRVVKDSNLTCFSFIILNWRSLSSTHVVNNNAALSVSQ